MGGQEAENLEEKEKEVLIFKSRYSWRTELKVSDGLRVPGLS